MQDKILKHIFTLFFAAALLLLAEGILISRGEKNAGGEQPQKKEIQKEQHQKNKR